MKIKGIITEDFINYKKPSMVIEMPYCTFKCDKECGRPVCQNSALANEPIITIPDSLIVWEYYINNPITEAIVFQGLEPFDSWLELKTFIENFRIAWKDDIVIYTGYDKPEIKHYLNILKKYDNIIIKYGRYIPDQEKKFDEVLGVYLASPNQYAEVLNG